MWKILFEYKIKVEQSALEIPQISRSSIAKEYPWAGIYFWYLPVADPGFSPGGGANSQKCYYFSIFCAWKWKTLDPQGGARVPGAPPWIRQCLQKELSLITRTARATPTLEISCESKFLSVLKAYNWPKK